MHVEVDDVSDDESVNDGGDVEDEPVECPERNELLHAIEILQRLSLFANEGDTIQSYANKIERNIDRHFTQKKKQTSITDFFKL